MHLNLNATEIEKTIASNRATSFGLTMVIGLPFPADVSRKFERIQQSIEALLPGRFTWYGHDQCHATLAAPLRGIYRTAPALTRDSLPDDPASFTRELTDIFSHTPPYTFSLGRVHLTPNGLLVIEEKTLGKQLAAIFQRHPRLDHPKCQPGLHITLGYLNTPQPFDTSADEDRLADLLTQSAFQEVGTVEIEMARLVHYANRTLNTVLGQIIFRLGQPNSLSPEELLSMLKIGEAQPERLTRN